MRCVRHLVSEDGGGTARFVEQLVTTQVGMGRRRFQVFGPPSLRLPPEVTRSRYVPIHRPWGLNHWKFGVLAAIRGRGASGPRPALRHTHSLTFGASDVHTVHQFYAREWPARAASRADRSGARRAVSRLQFELVRRLERRVLLRARAVVFVSSESREYAERNLKIRRPSAFHVIFPGVDGERYSPELRGRGKQDARRRFFPDLPPESRWLLFAGHDFDGKGLLRLLPELAAAERGLERPPRCQVLVFGRDAANRRKLDALIDSSGVRVRVFDDDARLVQAFGLSDILVMDSVSEGFALVLLEAMASGCVPVVTRFGGVDDSVRHGVNGIVGNNAADLARAALATDEATLAGMSDQAHRDASPRSWRAVAEEYEALYGTL